MAAGEPANTGEAGANHRVACFAGSPAPTGNGVTVKIVLVAVPEN
ncbi:diguanylate cyclase [Pseudomonas sp. BJP69]|nr:diguanylate cyclase [Pseudomonas sp. BJP69]